VAPFNGPGGVTPQGVIREEPRFWMWSARRAKLSSLGVHPRTGSTPSWKPRRADTPGGRFELATTCRPCGPARPGRGARRFVAPPGGSGIKVPCVSQPRPGGRTENEVPCAQCRFRSLRWWGGGPRDGRGASRFHGSRYEDVLGGRGAMRFPGAAADGRAPGLRRGSAPLPPRSSPGRRAPVARSRRSRAAPRAAPLGVKRVRHPPGNGVPY
jgi:hypothetical protein